MIFIFTQFIFLASAFQCYISAEKLNCTPIYVRWPRVRLNNHQQITGAGTNHQLTFADCQNACTKEKNPRMSEATIQCSAMNHRSGLSSFAQDCQLFSKEQVQHTDGYMEADDRYTFYWKFCIDTMKSCTGEYAFTFLSDRYMMKSDVAQTKFTNTLEECLAECLKDSDILCRSVSFNRTDGGCHMSEQNQLSKPSAIRINNDPNYRIDYYENNCYNNSFSFSSKCETDGIRVSVNSRIPYTGALYGLYDFFTCRIEPKESKQFEFLFPYSHIAKNCSDSMRQTGDDIVLEVVLSTDGVEPLYFITADDLTYQARCPFPKEHSIDKNSIYQTNWKKADEKKKSGATINAILESLYSASEPSLRHFAGLMESTTTITPEATTIQQKLTSHSTSKSSFTKDTFTLLPLYTLETSKKYDEVSMPSKPTNVQIRDSLYDNKESTAATITIALPNKTSAAFNANGRLQTILQPTTEKLTTIMDTLNGNENVAYKNSKIELPQENKKNRMSSKNGMEPIFEDFHNNTTNASDDVTTLKTTTKRAISPTALYDDKKEFSFSTHIVFAPNRIVLSTGSDGENKDKVNETSSLMVISTTSSLPSTTTRTTPVTTITTTTLAHTTTIRPFVDRGTAQREKIIFEIFHNGQPAEAVVVGSRVTLAFTPYFAIPPEHMAISGCQVEPIGSLYEWEKEPLAIIKDGCQADHVGLVCPPQKTDYGIRVTIEAFRYQTTTQVQYTCLIRVCPFATCPQVTCPLVEGCPGDDIVSRTFGINRAKRNDVMQGFTDQISALNDGATRRNVFGNRANLWSDNSQISRINNAHQQQLLLMGGDTLVQKQLIVVNTDEELKYYSKTGEIPHINPRK